MKKLGKTWSPVLSKEVSEFGSLVPPIEMVSLDLKSPQLKHVVCHRRHVTIVLKDTAGDLNPYCTFKVDNCIWFLFPLNTLSASGAVGHLVCTSVPPPVGAPLPLAVNGAPQPRELAGTDTPGEPLCWSVNFGQPGVRGNIGFGWPSAGGKWGLGVAIKSPPPVDCGPQLKWKKESKHRKEKAT